ncbi:hypothetical protein [Caenimonas koreensis]|uniref:hypothetical protein n=1 Tax=Caenimonas koreensis TaxID=367474 RepID=UPI003783C966
MIHVYCVQLVGEPFLLDQDGAKVEFGFYRNEYVAAWSEERAIAAAKARTLEKFSSRSTEMIEGRPMTLKVEKVTSKLSPLRLFENEGFLLFPVDSE